MTSPEDNTTMQHDLIPLTGNNSLTLPGFFAAQSFQPRPVSQSSGIGMASVSGDDHKHVEHT
jgi:hypothetical protein